MSTFQIVEADERQNLGSVPRREAARILGISIDTLESLATRNDGPARFRIGTHWSYPMLELRRWQERKLAEAGYRPEKAEDKRRRAAKGEGAAA